MKTALHWLGLLLVSSASTAAATQSVFDINSPTGDGPFEPWRETLRFDDNIHELQHVDKLAGQDPRLSAKGNPFLQAHREQCESGDVDAKVGHDLKVMTRLDSQSRLSTRIAVRRSTLGSTR